MDAPVQPVASFLVLLRFVSTLLGELDGLNPQIPPPNIVVTLQGDKARDTVESLRERWFVSSWTCWTFSLKSGLVLVSESARANGPSNLHTMVTSAHMQTCTFSHPHISLASKLASAHIQTCASSYLFISLSLSPSHICTPFMHTSHATNIFRTQNLHPHIFLHGLEDIFGARPGSTHSTCSSQRLKQCSKGVIVMYTKRSQP